MQTRPIKTSQTIATRGENGFTLLETLIALTILAIGLLGLLGLQIVALKGNDSGFRISTAVALGEQRIEELKELEASNALLTTGNHADGTTTIQTVVYTRSYVIADDTPVAGVSTLSMTITWTDPQTNTVRSTQIGTRILKG
jgi:type IV pilus assembly protein PilV